MCGHSLVFSNLCSIKYPTQANLLSYFGPLNHPIKFTPTSYLCLWIIDLLSSLWLQSIPFAFQNLTHYREACPIHSVSSLLDKA